MSATPDPRRLFTERHAAYARFIRSVGYRQGLRAFLMGWASLHEGLCVLDAGCGTGALTLALHDALTRRGLPPRALHGFDLTPAMLDRFRETIRRRAIGGIELAEADVLRLDGLPAAWTGYDLVVSASMLEYVPPARFVEAIAGLRGRLRDGGTFLLFMTRRNPLTRLLVGRWWESNCYTAEELRAACADAGFSRVAFRRFPLAAGHLAAWGHIVEARR